MRTSAFSACLSVCVLSAPALAAATPERWVWSHAYHIPPETTSEESGYFSLVAGLDGKLYIGTAKYGEDAYLVEFDPLARRFRIAVDAEKAIGTDRKGFAAQAKIHTRNHVGRSGKIYFATKQGYPREGEKREDYPGGHPMVYDPRTGKTRVYDIPIPHHGIISFVPDESRGLAYLSTASDERPVDSTHFMILDLATGRYRDLLDCRHLYAFIVLDHRGRAYHPVRGGKIARYDPDGDSLDILEQTIDGAPPPEDSLLARPEPHPINWEVSPDRCTLYAVPMQENALYAYDLTGDGTVLHGRRIGVLVAGAEATDCRALCVGPDGTVWAGVAAKRAGEETRLRLVSYRPGDPGTFDHGAIAIANPDYVRLEDDEGRPLPYRHGLAREGPGGALVPKHVIMAICAPARGRVYLTTLYPFTLHEFEGLEPPPAVRARKRAEKGGAGGTSRRTNFLLVMADDQGWGDMGYNGHPVLKTPNFDRAAASGLRFDRFYAAAPVCSPTRASVLTGRHPNRMGVFKWGYPLRPQETTLAEVLRAAGYRTAHFGKWHLGSVRRSSPVHPGRHGFDTWLSAPNFFDNDPILSREGEAVAFRGESSMVTVEGAIEWLRRSAGRPEPFFCVVWFGSPHQPHRALPEDLALYEGQPEPLRHFYGEITAMDRAFGRLREALRGLGLERNTLLWYTSDNGALPRVGSSGGHRGRKGKIYEGGLLVPAFIVWPARIREPRRTSVRATSSDIYPTLLDVAGVEPERQPPLDGVSLLPLIEGRMEKRPRAIGFWDYPARGISTPSARWMAELLEAQRAGRDLAPYRASLEAWRLPRPPYPVDRFPGHAAWIEGDWKLHRIEGKNGAVRWELYDLGADPKESRDLSGDPAAEPRLGRMRRGLEAWLRSVARSLNGEDYGA